MALFTLWDNPVTIYDFLLLLSVTAMGTVLAYLHSPKWKAIMLTLPIPFSLAFLSLGGKMGVTNVSGLIVLLVFTHAVRILYKDLRMPILPAIIVSAAGYCLIGSGLARVLPNTPMMFGGILLLNMALGLLLYFIQPQPEEQGHRTPLPVWLKAPLMGGVVVLLVLMKLKLQGFMTVFPMVGVIAAYEARHSLWANCRAIPVIMISLGPMMAVMFIAQHWLSSFLTLAVGWVVLLSILLPLTRDVWASPKEKAELPITGSPETA